MFCCLLNLTPTNLEWSAFCSLSPWPPYIGPVSDFTWEAPEFVNQHREDENLQYGRHRWKIQLEDVFNFNNACEIVFNNNASEINIKQF